QHFTRSTTIRSRSRPGPPTTRQMSDHFNLAPPLVPAGKSGDLLASNQALASTFSPLDNSFAVFLTNAPAKLPEKRPPDEEQPVYFGGLDEIPSAERRMFVTDSSVIFSQFQQLLQTARAHGSGWMDEDENYAAVRQFGVEYVAFIKDSWVLASQPALRPDGPLQFSPDHYRILCTCFAIFVLVYMPEPGADGAPVGEELMEWLNIHYIEPSTEEGDHLSSLGSPWQDESFWPYLTRATIRGLSKASEFFFKILSKHPSEDLQELAESMASLVSTQPRISNFDVERDFAYAFRRWRDKVKAVRVEMEKVPQSDRSDEYENWWDRLSDIVGVLEGRPEVVQRVCEELGADWKEVCAAWGVFVDPRLRRQDIPDVVGRILEDMPPDPTNREDMIHAAFLGGKPIQALEHAFHLDRWLSAHLADIMSPLSILGTITGEELSLRDHYILSYAEYLHADPALWRITVDYMYTCQHVGKERADHVLVRVPLRLNQQKASGLTDGLSEGEIRDGSVVGVLKDVNQACFEHRRESARRTVCRIAAQTFVREKHYGLAVSYSSSAEDWQGLGRIVDRVLDEYIISGPASFAGFASDIAPSLQSLSVKDGSTHGVFLHRLVFAVRYANFLQLCNRQELQNAASDIVAMFRDDVAPKSWWAVMLYDSVELLRYGPTLLFSTSGATALLCKLEEIFTRSAQGAGSDYLDMFARTIRGAGDKEALDRLKTVRLALAKYLARSAVLGA
ncbi:unnamed protein product, partial [Mycena citricolor]